MEHERGAKDDYHDFGLSNWKNGATITWDRKAISGEWEGERESGGRRREGERCVGRYVGR